MLLRTFKVIASLCMIFHICVCSATQRSQKQQQREKLFPGKRGSNLSYARCGEYVYHQKMIYDTINEAMLSLPFLFKVNAISEESVTYTPRKGEIMRLKPPYYFFLIVRDKHSPINDDQEDYVIITEDGRLAKVVSQIRYRTREAPGTTWRYEDCTLVYLKAPRARNTRKPVINL